MALRRLSTSSIQTNGKSSKLWDQTTFQSGMFAIATVSLTSTASSITFSGIPADYTHLQIRSSHLSSSTDSNIQMIYNGDTTAAYSTHYHFGDGTTTGAFGQISRSFAVPNTMANTTQPLVFVADILNYAKTNTYKTMRSLGGTDRNGGGYAVIYSALWNSQLAITSITLTAAAGTFNTYSHFALYGIKAG